MNYPYDISVEETIVLAVDDVVKKHTQLKPLHNLISTDADGYAQFNDAFMDAYRSSDIPFAIRSLLLRAYLGDTSVKRRPLTEKITIGIARRLMAWIATPERIVRGTGGIEDIPKCVSTLIGIRRTSDLQFISDAFTMPAWEQRIAIESGNCVAAQYGFTPGGLEVFFPLITWRSLTEEKCRFLASSPTERHAAWYFQTGIDALDLTNQIEYMEYLLQDRRGGRVQNNLPLPFADLLNIPRKSVPDTLAALDLLSLGYMGIIDWSALRADPLCLRSLFDRLAWPSTHRTQFKQLMEKQASRHLIGQNAADAVANKLIEGIFDTGFLFNLTRLTSSHGRLVKYAVYYDAIDTRKMSRWIAKATTVEGLACRLFNLTNNSALNAQGIRLRDLSNILGFQLLHDVNAFETLPSVALYALGVNEYSPANTISGKKAYRSKSKPMPTAKVGKKELERFLKNASDTLPQIAVLHHTYQGQLPEDIPVFLPASIANIFLDIPEGVLLSGPQKIPMGKDPYDRSCNPEWSSSDIRWLKEPVFA